MLQGKRVGKSSLFYYTWLDCAAALHHQRRQSLPCIFNLRPLASLVGNVATLRTARCAAQLAARWCAVAHTPVSDGAPGANIDSLAYFPLAWLHLSLPIKAMDVVVLSWKPLIIRLNAIFCAGRGLGRLAAGSKRYSRDLLSQQPLA